MIVHVKVTPSSSKNEIRKEGDKLVVRLAVAPRFGAANRALIELLQKHYGKPVKIIAGHKSRNKLVEIED